MSTTTSPLLPNVNYTQDQLYFIAFGQVRTAYISMHKLVNYAVNKLIHTLYAFSKFRLFLILVSSFHAYRFGVLSSLNHIFNHLLNSILTVLVHSGKRLLCNLMRLY